jgi:hypothetical protein
MDKPEALDALGKARELVVRHEREDIERCVRLEPALRQALSEVIGDLLAAHIALLSHAHAIPSVLRFEFAISLAVWLAAARAALSFAFDRRSGQLQGRRAPARGTRHAGRPSTKRARPRRHTEVVRDDPRVDGHIGDRIIPRHKGPVRQAFVEDAVETVGFVHIAFDRIGKLFARVLFEMMVLARHWAQAADLPEEPFERRHPPGKSFGKNFPVFSAR